MAREDALPPRTGVCVRGGGGAVFEVEKEVQLRESQGIKPLILATVTRRFPSSGILFRSLGDVNLSSNPLESQLESGLSANSRLSGMVMMSPSSSHQSCSSTDRKLNGCCSVEPAL